MYSSCYGSINPKPAHPSPGHLSDVCLLISKLLQMRDDGASLRIQMPHRGEGEVKKCPTNAPGGGGGGEDERAWN